MELVDLLRGLNIRAGYGRFEKPMELPYAVYLGAGQERFFGDNTIYSKKNDYTIEYYFRSKDSTAEERLESKLLEEGYIYEKSEDVYIDTEKVFVIYYTVWRKQYE